MPSKGAGPTIRHVTAVDPPEAEGAVADVYRRAEAELGIIDAPMTMLSPAPELLAPMWALLQESLLVGGREERIAKEVVATGIAVKNGCRYSSDAHAMMLHAAGEHELAEAARDGHAPPAYADLAAWGRDPRPDGPFTAEAAPRFIGTALAVECVTRLLGVLATNAAPHPAATTKLGRAVASRRARSVVAADLEPGRGLLLLDPRPGRPPAWAGDSPVGIAFAHLMATAATGRTLLPMLAAAGAEQTIARAVAEHGTALAAAPPALEEATELTREARAAAQLVATAAVAPARVTDAEVAAWRGGSRSDRDTVRVLTYAAAEAVARIEEKLSETVPAATRSTDA